MRPAQIALAAAVCSGCSAQISDGRDPSLGGIPTPDAATGTGTSADAGTGSGGDAGPTACSRRAVYLNFDGQALIQGPSDATLDQAQWMTLPSGTAPPYRVNDTGRDLAIQSIVDGVNRQLARFPITVTRIRPSAGNYVMVVYGGTASMVGSDFGAAVNQLDCGDARPNDVAWIADNLTGQRAINTTIGAIGFGLGLTATIDPGDCMCSWDNSCRSDNSAPCTLGSPIPRDPHANQRCTGKDPQDTSQDEVAVFRTAFCP
ncbi:MAG TPA: hypothetical protein VHT91_03845 [Kofleriaceae bacterium]|jgi:hypothetical protein|nr:hypothetical protein [Kofleriaceae bacterium]